MLSFLPFFMAAQVRIPYESRHLNISNGLPDNTIYSCFQDSRGYIWFCTANGASRFDGRTFHNFNIAEGLADSEISMASEDSQGRIWFHTINGRLSYFDIKTEQIVSYRTSSALQKANGSTYLTNITEGADSSIWILVERIFLKRLLPNGEVANYDIRNKNISGLFKDEQNRTVLVSDTFRVFDATRNTFINGAIFSKNVKHNRFGKVGQLKDVLYFEADDGVIEYKKGVFRKIISKDQIKNQFIRSISADSLGNIWIGVTNGYYGFDLKNKRKPRFQATKSHVSYVFMDKEGNRWVCTLGDGVLFFPAGYDNITNLNKIDGLDSDEITALAMTPQGDMAIATYPNTLHFFDKNKSAIYRTLDIKGLWDVRVKHIRFPNNQDLWLQTDNYKLDFFPDFSENYLTNPSSKAKQVLSLDMLLNKKLLMPNEVYPINNFIRASSTFKNIYFAKNGRIYTTSGVITELTPLPNNRATCRYFCENSRSRFYCITEDTHGTVWFGGTEGVCFLRPDANDVAFLKINFETTVNDIVVLPDDYLLCSTIGNGVFLVKDGKVLKNWQEKNGLSSNSCNRLLRLNDQTVFVATSKGVTRLNFDPLNPQNMYAIIYGGKDAKPSLFVNDLLLDGEKLYIASNDGLYSFKINDLKIQRNTPVLRLTQPNAYLIQPDTFLKLPYGWFYQQKEIKFNFRAIAFCNGEVMHYRYRLFRNGTLEKKDSIVLRADFTLPLVSLSNGAYMLEVETSRGDDIWSKPVRVYFEAPSAIYRSPFALLIYWLAFAFLTFQFFRWRSRRRSLRQRRDLERSEALLAFERRQLEWEQEAIRARIDPHFVFNALNGILTFVYKRDVDSIKIQLPRLARFIRMSLNLGKEDFITIEQEAQYLNDYLLLEKQRFEDKFDFSVTITEGVDAQKKMLPPLLLQIFVENAVKHGIGSLPNDKMGMITVIFENKADYSILCTITDNGVGVAKSLKEKQETDEHQSMGLNLAKRRIAILNRIYGEKYALDISDSPQGTVIALHILTIDV
jgi:ligand-binding sensor domain-containing protein/signal transduction histidine kinase